MSFQKGARLWSTGDLLHLAVRAEIVWDGPEVRTFAGAQRLVRFRVTCVVRRPAALPLRFLPPGWSPLLAATGDWDEAGRTARAEALRDTWRPFRVAAVADESPASTSPIVLDL